VGSTPRIEVPGSTLKLEKVRAFVAEHARRWGLAENIVHEVVLAVDEACSNVVRHAYRDGEKGLVEVRIRAGKDTFTVLIRDTGRAFDIDHYHPPDLQESIHRRRAGGFGVHIMRSLMDKVEYRSKGGYNEVRLTKFRPAEKASAT
jgi:serine/threonine-protein kinase RsbW